MRHPGCFTGWDMELLPSSRLFAPNLFYHMFRSILPRARAWNVVAKRLVYVYVSPPVEKCLQIDF